MYIPNAPPQPVGKGIHSATSISEENAITLTPDAKSKRIRRQKKNSKYKITEWSNENNTNSNMNTAKVLRDIENSGMKDLQRWSKNSEKNN